MPKGVEHSDINGYSLLYGCVESLMPKGVEHKEKQLVCNFPLNSVESLMPKGVEHNKRNNYKLTVF